MIIYSELTDKDYKTVEECLADEEKYLFKKKEEENREKKLIEERDKAFKEAIAACEKYYRLNDEVSTKDMDAAFLLSLFLDIASEER